MRSAHVEPWTVTDPEVTERKRAVAKLLFSWLEQSDIRQYTSREGYKLLIVSERRPS